MERRTKVVATIGPASESPAVLADMVAAGMDVARLSLSHGPLEETVERIGRVRRLADAADRFVGVLADLPGPKVRAAAFPDGGVVLAEGDVLDVIAAGPGAASDGATLAVDDPEVVAALVEGDLLAMGDGAVLLHVVEAGPRVRARVGTGGRVQGRPGVAVPTSRLGRSAPTPEDLRLLDGVAEAGADAVAISFVKAAGDIDKARRRVDGGPMLVAKIETREAVDVLDEVIAASDGVMVARGDLGIRCPLEDVPHLQKRIIRTGVAFGRPVITATQMLESMVRAPSPTRAEVSDVANAVFDGTSALMLSGETAIGADPANAVRTMALIAARAEREFDYLAWGRGLDRLQVRAVQSGPAPVRIAAAVSAAAWRAAVDADVAAIVACTATGTTARAISRFRPKVPVIAVTPSEATARQLAMAWGVTPIVTDHHGTTDDIVWFSVKAAVETGAVRAGDLIAVLVGSPTQPDAGTDTLRLVRVN